MKITFAGVVLADASIGLPPLEMKLNGTRVAELVDLARAAVKGVFSRGNATNIFVFSTSTEYGSYADAQDAYFLAEAQAPVSGAVQIFQTGAAGNRPPLTMATAVLTAVAPVLLGVRVDTTFTLTGGRFAGGAAVAYQKDLDSPDLMFGSTPIPAGADHVAVAFPAPLALPVVSGVTLVAPTGADSPSVWKIEQVTGSESGGNGGFVGYLDGPVPAAGYSLNWQARAGTGAAQ